MKNARVAAACARDRQQTGGLTIGCWVVEPSLDRPFSEAEDRLLRVQLHCGRAFTLIFAAFEVAAGEAVSVVIDPFGSLDVMVVAAFAAFAAFWMLPDLSLLSLALLRAMMPPAIPPAAASNSSVTPPPMSHHFFLLLFAVPAAAAPLYGFSKYAVLSPAWPGRARTDSLLFVYADGLGYPDMMLKSCLNARCRKCTDDVSWRKSHPNKHGLSPSLISETLPYLDPQEANFGRNAERSTRYKAAPSRLCTVPAL